MSLFYWILFLFEIVRILNKKIKTAYRFEISRNPYYHYFKVVQVLFSILLTNKLLTNEEYVSKIHSDFEHTKNNFTSKIKTPMKKEKDEY